MEDGYDTPLVDSILEDLAPILVPYTSAINGTTRALLCDLEEFVESRELSLELARTYHTYDEIMAGETAETLSYELRWLFNLATASHTRGHLGLADPDASATTFCVRQERFFGLRCRMVYYPHTAGWVTDDLCTPTLQTGPQVETAPLAAVLHLTGFPDGGPYVESTVVRTSNIHFPEPPRNRRLWTMPSPTTATEVRYLEANEIGDDLFRLTEGENGMLLWNGHPFYFAADMQAPNLAVIALRDLVGNIGAHLVHFIMTLEERQEGGEALDWGPYTHLQGVAVLLMNKLASIVAAMYHDTQVADACVLCFGIGVPATHYASQGDVRITTVGEWMSDVHANICDALDRYIERYNDVIPCASVLSMGVRADGSVLGAFIRTAEHFHFPIHTIKILNTDPQKYAAAEPAEACRTVLTCLFQSQGLIRLVTDQSVASASTWMAIQRHQYDTERGGNMMLYSSFDSRRLPTVTMSLHVYQTAANMPNYTDVENFNGSDGAYVVPLPPHDMAGQCWGALANSFSRLIGDAVQLNDGGKVIDNAQIQKIIMRIMAHCHFVNARVHDLAVRCAARGTSMEACYIRGGVIDGEQCLCSLCPPSVAENTLLVHADEFGINHFIIGPNTTCVHLACRDMDASDFMERLPDLSPQRCGQVQLHPSRHEMIVVPFAMADYACTASITMCGMYHWQESVQLRTFGNRRTMMRSGFTHFCQQASKGESYYKCDAIRCSLQHELLHRRPMVEVANAQFHRANIPPARCAPTLVNMAGQTVSEGEDFFWILRAQVARMGAYRSLYEEASLLNYTRIGQMCLRNAIYSGSAHRKEKSHTVLLLLGFEIASTKQIPRAVMFEAIIRYLGAMRLATSSFGPDILDGCRPDTPPPHDEGAEAA